MTDRRSILRLALGLAGGQLMRAAGADAAQQPPPAAPSAAQAFDFAWLKGQAHWLASNAFQPSKDVLPPAMGKLGYDQYQSIRFRGDHALWADAGLAFRVQFFHVGRTFTEPVHLYEVIDGQAREILYDPAMFEWDKSGVDPAVMKDRAGFAGFQGAIHHRLERLTLQHSSVRATSAPWGATRGNTVFRPGRWR